jgi:hypothetical protein
MAATLPAKVDRKRRSANIVPRKAHGKPDRTGVEEKPRDRHISLMTNMTNPANEWPLPTAPAAPGTPESAPAETAAPQPKRPSEIGGPKGPEPTRYGDWEFNGRCTDF